MNKKIQQSSNWKQLGAFIIIISLVCFIGIGCSDDDNPIVSIGHDPDLVGVWVKTLQVCDGVSQNYLALTFTMNADGTGTMVEGGMVGDFTWSTSGNHLTFALDKVGEKPDIYSYTVNDNIFIATQTSSDGSVCQYTLARQTM